MAISNSILHVLQAVAGVISFCQTANALPWLAHGSVMALHPMHVGWLVLGEINGRMHIQMRLRTCITDISQIIGGWYFSSHFCDGLIISWTLFVPIAETAVTVAFQHLLHPVRTAEPKRPSRLCTLANICISGPYKSITELCNLESVPPCFSNKQNTPRRSLLHPEAA